MLWAIIILLFVVWLLGVMLKFAGGIIHVLLVLAVILFVVNLIRGRRPAA